MQVVWNSIISNVLSAPIPGELLIFLLQKELRALINLLDIDFLSSSTTIIRVSLTSLFRNVTKLPWVL